MAKSQKFPIPIKAGVTAINFHRSPLRVPVSPDRQAAPGPDAAEPEVTTCDSCVVVFYPGGERVGHRFYALDLAQAEAARLRASLLNDNSAGLQITGDDLLAYTRASHLAQTFVLSLEQLAKEYAAARKVLGNVGPLEAAAQAVARGGRRRKNWTLAFKPRMASVRAPSRTERG